MKIFDVHTHTFPDKIAPKAIEHLRELSRGIPAYTDGTAAALERAALKAGYTAWMNCPVVTNAKQMSAVNDRVAAENCWPHLSMGGLYPNAPLNTVIKEVARIKSLGLCGIKFHPEYQEFDPSDPKFDPLWQAIADAGLPVLFHAGDDVGFYGTRRHSSPKSFALLARRLPKLTIICAHMGGWRNWDEVERDLVGSPVYFDTSFSKPWMGDRTQFERIIRNHGVERILFGTDSPWNDLTDGIREITEAALSDSAKEAIFYGNAAKLFHFPS